MRRAFAKHITPGCGTVVGLQQIRSGCDILSLVMRGLDPRIHADWPQAESAAWIAGSSPAMTNGEVRFQFNRKMLSFAQPGPILPQALQMRRPMAPDSLLCPSRAAGASRPIARDDIRSAHSRESGNPVG